MSSASGSRNRDRTTRSSASPATHLRFVPGPPVSPSSIGRWRPADYSRALLLARARTDPARLLPVLREAARRTRRSFRCEAAERRFRSARVRHPDRQRRGWVHRPADAAARVHRHFRRRVVRRDATHQGDRHSSRPRRRQGIDPAADHARGVVARCRSAWSPAPSRPFRSASRSRRARCNWRLPTRSHMPVRWSFLPLLAAQRRCCPRCGPLERIRSAR